jgi:hypothetical protein
MKCVLCVCVCVCVCAIKFFFSVLGMEPRALSTLGKCSLPVPSPSPVFIFTFSVRQGFCLFCQGCPPAQDPLASAS